MVQLMPVLDSAYFKLFIQLGLVKELVLLKEIGNLHQCILLIQLCSFYSKSGYNLNIGLENLVPF